MVELIIDELLNFMRKYTDLYVSVDGNDSNSGLNYEDSFRSIQKAIDTSYYIIGDVKIFIADGKYNDVNIIVSGSRQGNLEIIGNINDPNKVILDSGDNPTSAATIWAVNGANLMISGMKILATTKQPPLFASCIRSTYNSLIIIKGEIIFGNAAYAQILVGNARVIINSSYNIDGSAMYHIFCSTSSSIATTADQSLFVNIKKDLIYDKSFACVQTLSIVNWRLPFKLNGNKIKGVRHIISDAGCIAMKAIGSDPNITPDKFPGDRNGKNISGFYNGKVYGRKFFN